MAQSLDSRINAALRSAARLKDVESVISDVRDEIAATEVKLDEQTTRSIDPALTTPEAREARNNAADLEHDIRRLNASLGMLEEARDRIITTTAEAKRAARYDAAKAERDDLARHIRTRYPEIATELLAMVRRIEASEQQVAAANNDRPRGAEALVSAENLARECRYTWDMSKGGGPVMPLARMTLPLLGREGNYLPEERSPISGSPERWLKSIAADQEFGRAPVAGVAATPADDQPSSFAA